LLRQPDLLSRLSLTERYRRFFSVEEVEAVMIRHGNYFTTYSNLSAATVKKGDFVKMGQVLGRIGEIGQLEFIISDEKDQRFNPQQWLRR